MAHGAGLMRVLSIQPIRYGISIAVLIALIWISLGPVRGTDPFAIAFAAGDPVIAAAGDIACDPASPSFNDGEGNQLTCRQQYTSDLLIDAGLTAVLPLGDVQYHCGGYQAFLQSYDRSWGRVKDISRPVVGNHEYLLGGGTDCSDANEGAAGYFSYFGSAAGSPTQGYYSYDIGAWHLIALNSNCNDAGGCEQGSPQAIWLANDLDSHRNLCTLAYWHIPLFSSGGRTADNTRVLWQILYDRDVELILNGHDHTYERFAPQAPDGTLDLTRGIRQFVVGTGGSNLTQFETIAANSEVRNNDTYGVLKLTLHPTSYDWEFVPEAGKTFTDTGSEQCHGTGSVSIPQAGSTHDVMPVPTLTPVPPATSAFTYTAVADAYISKTLPMANFGTSNMLRVYGGPLGASYLRFTIRDLPGTIQSVTLRLYAHTSSKAGYQVRTMAHTDWSESTITYGNAPPIGDLIAISESFEAKQWTSVDVSSLVRGNGTYDFVLFTFDGAPLSLASRNAIAPYAPQLVVNVITNSIVIPTLSPTVPATPTLIAAESPE